MEPSCCHPPRHSPGSKSGSSWGGANRGRDLPKTALGTLPLPTTALPPPELTPMTVVLAGSASDTQRSHIRVSCPEHGQAVSPTCPIRWWTQPFCFLRPVCPPQRLKQNADVSVMADFGQTDFGQTTLASLFCYRVWPNRLWPKPTLAKTDFGQNRLWPKPTLAKTDFGQNRLWPKPTLAKPTLAKSSLICCVVCCVVCCMRGVGTVSRYSGVSCVGVGFKVWFGPSLPLDRPSPGPPKISRFFFFPLPLQNSLFSSLSGGLLVEFWWCMKHRGVQMCTFGVLGLSCASPGGPGLVEGRKRTNFAAGQEKKARNFGPPPFGPPPFEPPHPFGAPPFRGPHPFGPPPFRAPTLRGPHPLGPLGLAPGCMKKQTIKKHKEKQLNPNN